MNEESVERNGRNIKTKRSRKKRRISRRVVIVVVVGVVVVVEFGVEWMLGKLGQFEWAKFGISILKY